MGQIIQLIDSYTKENVNYEEVTTWHDGTQMDDSKVDNVIYRKKGTTYFKRSFSQTISALWFGVLGDGVTDDSAAMQRAIDFCVKTKHNLDVPRMCKISTTLYIDRLVDGEKTKEYFVILSSSMGGFIVSSTIPLFSTRLSYQGAPVSQLIQFRGISFSSTNKDLQALVLDSGKFLRTQFNYCNFVDIGLLYAPKYVQSIHLINCNARGWLGGFFTSLERSYDVRIQGGLYEAGGAFKTEEGYKSGGHAFHLEEPYGCHINSCIEGIAGTAVIFHGGYGIDIGGCYFEGNHDGDINLTGTKIARGVNIHGNFFYNTNTTGTTYSILWGYADGAISHGNTTPSRLHFMPDDYMVNVDVDVKDTAEIRLCNKPLPDWRIRKKELKIQYVNQNFGEPNAISYYIRNGNLVNFIINITFPTTNIEDEVLIGGLPYPSMNIEGVVISGFTVIHSSIGVLYVRGGGNTSQFYLEKADSTLAKYSELSNNTISIHASYLI